jgi:N-acetylglucosamine malate deacetylase 1
MEQSMIMARKILVLGAHPDDGEFGCGGTIARFIEEGREVYYAIFSLCEKSVPENLPRDILFKEFHASIDVLGMPEDHLFVFNYEVRTFPTFRQEILEDLVVIRNQLNPDLILMPSPNDLHQDHSTLSKEGLRAFKGSSILGYEQAWNNLTFDTTAFVFLKHRHVEKKIQATQCYRSQAFRSYSEAKFIESLAEVRGTQIDTEYAEAFDVIRFVLS